MNSRTIGRIAVILFILLPGVIQAQKVTKVGAICITVRELAPSLKFYTDVLQFKHIGTESFYGENHEKLFSKFGVHYKVAHLQLGDEYVDLIDYLTSGGRSISETQKSNDLEFQHIAIVVRDMDSAFAILQANSVEFVSTVPQTIPPGNVSAAGIKAFYFHDIDNHNLELIYFPEGKGKGKWQEHTSSVFLGVDHTAISIGNTSRSFNYWVNYLSFEKKGESHNVGTEQAHLNCVENAELQITGLAVSEGPGVEFLEYLKPGPGSKFPADTQCDDLWNWLTKVSCKNIDALFEKLASAHAIIVSESVVVINGKKSFISRDPDGHAVWFIED